MRKIISELDHEIEYYQFAYRYTCDACNKRHFGIGRKTLMLILIMPIAVIMNVCWRIRWIGLTVIYYLKLLTWKLRQKQKEPVMGFFLFHFLRKD